MRKQNLNQIHNICIAEFQIVSQKRYEKILTDLFQLLFLLTHFFIIFNTFRSLPIGTSLLNIYN